jgi:hypothetical protein
MADTENNEEDDDPLVVVDDPEELSANELTHLKTVNASLFDDDGRIIIDIHAVVTTEQLKITAENSKAAEECFSRNIFVILACHACDDIKRFDTMHSFERDKMVSSKFDELYDNIWFDSYYCDSVFTTHHFGGGIQKKWPAFFVEFMERKRKAPTASFLNRNKKVKNLGIVEQVCYIW